MAGFQVEQGSCLGRGFADVDTNGFLAKFKTWVVKTYVNGGANWVILRDASAAPTAISFTVNTTTDICTATAHGLKTGDEIVFNTTGSVGGLSNTGAYYLRRVDADTFYLCSNRLNSNKPSSYINLTSSTGTHTVTRRMSFIDIAPTSISSNNSVSKILRIGMYSASAGKIKIYNYLSWNTDDSPRGVWGDVDISSLDSATFAYFFSAGEECIYIGARISTTWTWFLLDEWEGISNFVEGESVIGTLQNNESSGSNVVVELATGEASLFSVNKYYYLYDFSDKNIVEYVKVTARNTTADTITFNLTQDVSSGAKIGAYPHRYYCYTNKASGYSYRPAFIPYVSHTTPARAWYSTQEAAIYLGVNLAKLEYLDKLAPNDEGKYACMAPIIAEERCNYASYYSEQMNRMYGKAKNLFKSYGTMSQMQDTRTINSIEYIKINSDSLNDLFRYTESTS
jgi:hypothetical protein